MTVIRGLNEAMQKLQEIGAEGERIASRELVASALAVQGRAKLILTETDAVDTGRLRNSVTVAPTDTELDLASGQATGGPPGSGEGTPAPTMVRPGMLGAKIGTNVEYAREVHFGTQGMHARPYLVPAAQAERPRMLRRLSAELKKLERT